MFFCVFFFDVYLLGLFVVSSGFRIIRRGRYHHSSGFLLLVTPAHTENSSWPSTFSSQYCPLSSFVPCTCPLPEPSLPPPSSFHSIANVPQDRIDKIHPPLLPHIHRDHLIDERLRATGIDPNKPRPPVLRIKPSQKKGQKKKAKKGLKSGAAKERARLKATRAKQEKKTGVCKKPNGMGGVRDGKGGKEGGAKGRGGKGSGDGKGGRGGVGDKGGVGKGNH